MELRKGYKQTEVGLIPDDWTCEKLPNVINYIHGKAHEQYVDENGDFVIVNSKFISTEGEIRKFSKRNFQSAKIGDILTVLSDLPNGKALAKCFYVDKDDFYAVNQRVCIWRSKGADASFLYHVLNRNKYFLNFNDGVSQTHILNKHIEECPIQIPQNKTEQTAIATALSDMDNLIAGLEKLIEKKKAIKQGAMQELLKPKEGWVVKKLGELGECIIGLTYKPDDVQESGILVLRSSNIQENVLCFNDNVYVDVNVSEKLIVQENDILICVRNGSRDLIGKCALIVGEAVGETFGAFMSVFRSHYNKYLINCFRSDIIKKQIDEHLGATINQITNKSLNSFEVPFPSIEEQNEIISKLSEMDLEIEKQVQKLSKFKLLKQGMMHELLTGKTRLI